LVKRKSYDLPIPFHPERNLNSKQQTLPDLTMLYQL